MSPSEELLERLIDTFFIRLESLPLALPNQPSIYYSADSPPKVRVAVFGSFHGGYHVLRELLREPLASRIVVTGLATDDPKQPFTHASVRLWRHVHTKAEEEWVAKMARQHDVPVHRGRIKAPDFEQMFVEDWAPDLCLIGYVRPFLAAIAAQNYSILQATQA